MEKRLFLAVILSFVVLYVWNIMYPSPSVRHQPTIVEPQTSNANLSTTNTVDNLQAETPQAPTIIENQEQKSAIETNNLIVEFSSLGGAIKQITLKNYQAIFPTQHIAAFTGDETRTFNIVTQDPLNIIYSYEDGTTAITKAYHLKPDSYLIEADYKIYDKTNMSKQEKLDFIGMGLDMSSLDIKKTKQDAINMRNRSLYEYVVNSSDNILRKSKVFKFDNKETKQLDNPVQWIGFRDRYYCLIVKPLFPTLSTAISPIDTTHLNIAFKAIATDNSEYNFVIYAGPEKKDLLKEQKQGFEQITRYYRSGVFDIPAKIVYSLLQLVHKITKNWGFSIIILSLIVYFSMYPMTMRSMISMRKMQQLQPQINLLREKHKNNAQKMHQEVMELYKKNNVNPLGGCLPMIFQMPVFIGLYQVLWRSVDFKGATFLWIKDLSEPDRLIILKKVMPVIGTEFNILPIIMLILMIIQMRLSSKNMVVTDPMQAQQQKMMNTLFPIMFGFMFYKMPSGLNIYFIMFYFLSTMAQLKMKKYTIAPDTLPAPEQR